MRRNKPALVPAAALLGALAAFAVPAAAAPVLIPAPEDTTIVVAQTVALSIGIAEPLALRTVELWVRYDPAVIDGVSGRPGLLFRTCGAYVWSDYEETSPGRWHGFAVVMGSTAWVTGPGELYEWTFRGLAPGITSVEVDSMRLFDPQANVIPGAALLPAQVRVWDPALADVPPAGSCGLWMFPNPFNPNTRVRFSLAEPGPVRLEVLDLLGRTVDVLLAEPDAAAGPREAVWDGRDAAGREAPSGVYLFRLRGRGSVAALRRGTLLR